MLNNPQYLSYFNKGSRIPFDDRWFVAQFKLAHDSLLLGRARAVLSRYPWHAEDALQETYIRLTDPTRCTAVWWHRGSALGYARRVLFNCAIDTLRKDKTLVFGWEMSGGAEGSDHKLEDDLRAAVWPDDELKGGAEGRQLRARGELARVKRWFDEAIAYYDALPGGEGVVTARNLRAAAIVSLGESYEVAAERLGVAKVHRKWVQRGRAVLRGRVAEQVGVGVFGG